MLIMAIMFGRFIALIILISIAMILSYVVASLGFKIKFFKGFKLTTNQRSLLIFEGYEVTSCNFSKIWFANFGRNFIFLFSKLSSILHAQ